MASAYTLYQLARDVGHEAAQIERDRARRDGEFAPDRQRIGIARRRA